MTQKYFTHTKSTILQIDKTQYSKRISHNSSIQSNNQRKAITKIITVLQKKITNKKRYNFQILKQFFLFSDSSLNSTINNNSSNYAVLLGEQKLHSLFKILQTQLIQRKIWAFLNLRLSKIIRNLTKAIPICSTILQRKQSQYKLQAFELICMEGERREIKLNHHKTISIKIGNKTPTKSFRTQKHNKSEYNMSRQTEIDSYGSQKSLQFKPPCNSYTCQGCSVCCCSLRSCQFDYNLQQRMEYLRMLEQYAKQNGIQ